MRYVIIGGSHAGISCALRLREDHPDADIVIYEKQNTVGFVAQSIPLYLLGAEDFQSMSSYTSVDGLASRGIEVHTLTVVQKIDPAAKVITYSTYGKQPATAKYDKLVIATGSYPSLPMVTGDFTDKICIIKDYADAVKIKDLMAASKTFIVIGGGAIGIEMSRLLVKRGLSVVMLQAASRVLPRYMDPELSQLVEKYCRGLGIQIELGAVITEIAEVTREDGQLGVKVTVEDGRTFEADGAIYATGFRPNSFLVRNLCTLGKDNAILVDDYMQTSVPDIFAVGDCATTKVTNMREPQYVPHASDAIRQGEIAAMNIEGRVRPVPSSQGTYNLNFVDRVLCSTGMTLEQALGEGWDAAVAFGRNEFRTSEQYYEAWLIFEKGTHLILGIQVRGRSLEVSSYADLFSLAIDRRMKISDLEFVDFFFKHGYSDPRGFCRLMADAVREVDPLPTGETRE